MDRNQSVIAFLLLVTAISLLLLSQHLATARATNPLFPLGLAHREPGINSFPNPGTAGHMTATGTVYLPVVIGSYPKSCTIQGTVYHDLNGNGSLDTGEQGIQGVPIYVNDNQMAISAADGSYCIADLAPGQHRVNLRSPSSQQEEGFFWLAKNSSKYVTIDHVFNINVDGSTALDFAAMQGILSMVPKNEIFIYFDLDPRQGFVRNYLGDTTPDHYPDQPGTGDGHTGLDILCDVGDDVFAFAPGRVVFAGQFDHGAKAVELVHPDGTYTHYGHLSLVLAEKGQHVSQNQLIGKCGMTGTAIWPHIHFQRGDRNGHPIDPFHDLFDPTGRSQNHWIEYNDPHQN
jgi:hypothetical protein